jgi:hypothetical protein
MNNHTNNFFGRLPTISRQDSGGSFAGVTGAKPVMESRQ